MADSVLINGSCDPAFKAVCEALAQNLAEKWLNAQEIMRFWQKWADVRSFWA